MKNTYKNIQRIFTNFQVIVKILTSLTVLLLQDLKATCEEQQGSKADVKNTFKNIKRIFTNFQVIVKILRSLTVLLLQDLKATCEEQQGSNSMDSTTEVSNFGHYQFSEIGFLHCMHRLDNWLFPWYVLARNTGTLQRGLQTWSGQFGED